MCTHKHPKPQKIKPTSWRCSGCNSKIAQLQREFGNWPTGAFKDVPHELQVEFYRSCSSLHQMRAKVEELSRRYEKHEETFEQGGAFLPLSVWAVQGWDVDRIEKYSRPEDVIDDLVQGRTYRLRIRSATTLRSRGLERERNEHAEGSGKRLKRSVHKQLEEVREAAAANGDADAAQDECSTSGSDSNSSSSDSSSSSRKKKSKKNKKASKKKTRKSAKKAKKLKAKAKAEAEAAKAAAKQDRTERAAREKAAKQMTKTADDVLPKALDIKEKLQHSMSQPRCLANPDICDHSIAFYVI